MKDNVIIAGFGGQGVLLAGMILAQAAVEEDKLATWFPSYGAEMRGGTANSIVRISDEGIGSPVVFNPSTVIAMNPASLNKFLPRVTSSSLIIYNSSLIKDKVERRSGSTMFAVPATELADKELKFVRTANMVLLGVYFKKNPILNLQSAKSACEKAFKGKQDLIDINKKALDIGYNL